MVPPYTDFPIPGSQKSQKSVKSFLTSLFQREEQFPSLEKRREGRFLNNVYSKDD